MLRRSLASSLFQLGIALALALPLAGGCGKAKPKLTEVEVPEAGITMRYDLSPGQEYAGHVKMRNTIATPVGDVITLVEFDVAMVVSANADAGGKLVRATVKGIELELRLPEGLPAAAAGGMTPEAAAALNGMELRFNLSERGEVSNEPEPPKEAPMETQAMIGMITSALTSGFVRLPEQAVKDGESWDATSNDPELQVKSSKNTGTLKGLGRNAAGEDIAQLGFAATLEAEREGKAIKASQEVEAAFSTTGGYLVSLARKINNEVAGQTIYSEVEAAWTKGGKQAVEAPAPAPAGEVQTITDPCDPDYVGAEECAGATSAPEAAAPKG